MTANGKSLTLPARKWLSVNFARKVMNDFAKRSMKPVGKWYGMFLLIVFVGASAGWFFYDMTWLVLLPFLIHAVFLIYINMGVRCPSCRIRMRARLELMLDPRAHKRVFDCSHCRVVWDPHMVERDQFIAG